MHVCLYGFCAHRSEYDRTKCWIQRWTSGFQVTPSLINEMNPSSKFHDWSQDQLLCPYVPTLILSLLLNASLPLRLCMWLYYRATRWKDSFENLIWELYCCFILIWYLVQIPWFKHVQMSTIWQRYLINFY